MKESKIRFFELDDNKRKIRADIYFGKIHFRYISGIGDWCQLMSETTTELGLIDSGKIRYYKEEDHEERLNNLKEGFIKDVRKVCFSKLNRCNKQKIDNYFEKILELLSLVIIFLESLV